MIDRAKMLAELDKLKPLASEDPLHESGRHFVDGSYSNLTSCHHGDTGEYHNDADGEAIAILWNLWKAGALFLPADPPHQTQMARQSNVGAIPDLPKRLWIDPRDLKVHFTEAEGRLPFLQGQAPKKHAHYKTGDDVARMCALAAQGLTQKQIAKALGVQPRTVRNFVGRVYGQHQAAFTPAEIADILEKANG